MTNQPVVDFFFAIDPKSGQFWEDINDFESFQIVNENVGQPQIVNQLEVNWKSIHKKVLNLKGTSSHFFKWVAIGTKQ
jgi:hypothetical protein